MCFFLDLLVFMICSVNSHATPPHQPLELAAAFFTWLATCYPCLKGFLAFVQGHLLPLCQGILPKKWLGSCMLVGIIGLSLVARAFPCGKGCQKH